MIDLEKYKEYENYDIVLDNAKNIISDGGVLKGLEFDPTYPNAIHIADLVISNVFLAIKNEVGKYFHKLDITHYNRNWFKPTIKRPIVSGPYVMEFSDKIVTPSNDVVLLGFIVEIDTDTKTVKLINCGNKWDCLNPTEEEVDVIGFELYNYRSNTTIPVNNLSSNNITDIFSYNTCDNELVAAAIIIHDLELEFKEFESIVTTLLLFRGINEIGPHIKDKDISYILTDRNEDSFTIHAKHDNGKTVEIIIEHG